LGNHNVHLQENKDRVLLHPTTQRPTTATNHIQQNQRSTPYAVTYGLWFVVLVLLDVVGSGCGALRCRMRALTSVSTCFGHHYAHLQENKDRVTAFGVLL